MNESSIFRFLKPYRRWILTGIVLIPMALLVHYAIQLFSYPYDWDTLEGDLLNAVIHLYEGRSLYSDDAFLIYPPLLFVLVVPLMFFFEPGIWMVRLFSLLATVGVTALVYDWIRRETGSQALSWMGVSFLLSAKLFGMHFLFARVDPAFTFMSFLSFYLAYRWVKSGARGSSALFLGVVLSSLAAGYIKQSAVFLCVALFLFLWKEKSLKSGLLYGVSVGSLALLIFGGIEGWTDGGFSISLLGILIHQTFVPLITFVTLSVFVLLTGLLWLFLFTQWTAVRSLLKGPLSILPISTFVMTAGSLYLTFNSGAGAHYYLPVWPLLIVFTFIVWARFEKTRPKRWRRSLALGLLVTQFLLGFFFGSRRGLFMTPTATSYTYAEAIDDVLADHPGPVQFEMMHLFALHNDRSIPLYPSSVRFMAKSGHWDPQVMVDRIEAQDYSLLVTQPTPDDQPLFGVPEISEAIEAYYEPIAELPVEVFETFRIQTVTLTFYAPVR